MSIRVMSLVWENFPRGGSDKLVMLAMADWCNDQGGSLHPSIATVAKKINLTEKQARVIVHRLIAEGWLSVVGNEYGGNPGASRHYQLQIKKLTTPAEVSPTPPAKVTPPADVTPPAEVRDPSRGGSFTPPVDGSLSTIDPPKEPPIPPKEGKKQRVVEKLPLPSWLDTDAWDMWMRHRKTLSPDAHNTSIRSLTKLRDQGHDPVEVIEQSVMAGWTGLFQIKQTQARASPGYESAKDRSRREFTESIFGKAKNESTGEHDITGFAERVD